MKKIAIYGSGGFGREVQTFWIEHINAFKPEWEFIGFYDDGKAKGDLSKGYTILGGIKDLNEVNYSLAVVIGIGDPIAKKKVYNSIKSTKIYFPSLIHPSVIFANNKFITIGEGCLIGPGNVLSVDLEIGNHVMIDAICTIGHDTKINDFVSVMPGVNISGEVIIEESVFIGTGAKIINRVRIGRETIVGAGSIVSKSLPEKCTAVGIPAKPIKFHE